MNTPESIETEARSGSCAPATCSAWRRTTEIFPQSGVEVEITHPQFIGTRTARLDTIAPFIGWRLTDCTHPAQNAYVPMEGSAWRAMPNDKLCREAGAKDL